MISFLENLIFGHRRSVVAVFVAITLFMAWSATHLRLDAGFLKLLPLDHPYMKTFVKYRDEFGGANHILVALTVDKGDIFTPEFFKALKAATDEVFFLPGVDRSSVTSLFTPNVRFTEVVEDGISGGNVIPADFEPTKEGLARVRENVLKAGIVGRLVANDFSGAMISAELQEVNPGTGRKLDYVDVSHRLDQIRKQFTTPHIGVHIIGFAKVIGDIADGAARVVLFFAVAFVITALLVYFYTRAPGLTVVPLACSLIAVVWQLGLLPLLGFGIDPMSILVPFLIFAIGVSHGVQMVSAVRSEIYHGADAGQAARASFRRLLVPGGVALASDCVGFVTILLIHIRIIQEMAITASLGVAVITLTNLILIPVLLSFLRLDESYRERLVERARVLQPLWTVLARAARPRPASLIIGVAALLLLFGLLESPEVRIGDLHRGVPELRPDSTYNRDTEVITRKFSIGVDRFSVIAETVPNACINYAIMTAIDRFGWEMENVRGVQSVADLPEVAKIINAGWNEGSLKWRVIPRNPKVLAQAVSPVPTSSGLLNRDCSAMPVHVFTKDHEARTIRRIVDAAKRLQGVYGRPDLHFRLASGNVGVMAATNEAVEAAQFPILLYVFAAVVVMCVITFRSLRGMLCVVLPLALVSLLTYALMALLGIGLKVNTLPVVALGAGIGVDYGIYIFSRFQSILKDGLPITEAYEETLAIAGNGVLFTGLTLAMGVATWIFAPLQFQADLGLLLTFMFLVNMLGAILLLPALACWLLRGRRSPKPAMEQNE